METAIEYQFEMTNTCSCTDINYETGEETPSEDCRGWCWDEMLEDWKNITEHLFVDEYHLFLIVGFPVWNGTQNGYAKAPNSESLLRAMTVDGEWHLRGTVYADRIEATLSHHDVPMGGTMTVTPIAETD